MSLPRDGVVIADLRRSRPILRHLRFDDDLILAVAPEAVLQETAPGQAPDQAIHFLVERAVGRKGVQRQTRRQVLRAIQRLGAEFSQIDGIALEQGGDGAVRLRFQRDVTAGPGGKGWWRDPPSFFSGSAQAGGIL
jgi:hypothetical protein